MLVSHMATGNTAGTDFDTRWLLARAYTPFVTHVPSQKHKALPTTPVVVRTQ